MHVPAAIYSYDAIYGGRRCLFAQRSRRPRQQGRQRLSRWRAEISAGPGLPQGSFEAEDSPATERHAVVRELESVGRLCLSGVPAAQLRPGGELRRVGASLHSRLIRASPAASWRASASVRAAAAEESVAAQELIGAAAATSVCQPAPDTADTPPRSRWSTARA
jgi:hypothetical protein